MEDININEIIDKINYLKTLREELLESELSPEGAWIHQYKIHRSYPSGYESTYIYSKWQADKPIFKRNPKKNALPVKSDKNEEYTNHQHIGSINDPKVEQAYKSWNNRKTLENIEKAFERIEAIIYFLPFPNSDNTDDFK
ncbi:MAG: hypothetical protein AAF383_12655 [Cyanobacteria bacterium P01_A01_bin.83]